jgi:hypothetical protein
VRARGLSVYQIVFAGGQALGALLWGAVAQTAGLVVTYVVAGGVMLAGAATVRIWPLREVGGLNRDPAIYWPEPDLALEPDPHAGPVLITLAFTVPPERQERFVAAMRWVGRSRRRTGATQWGLFRDGDAPDVFLEVYLVDSWSEHLRQHGGRLTGYDQQREQEARALAEGEPEVRHLLPAEPLTEPIIEPT